MRYTSRVIPVQRLPALLVLIALAAPVFCTVKYMRYELFQLVCRADLVVAGTIRSVDHEHWWQRLFGGSEKTRGFELEVEETIAGSPVTGSLTVHCFEDWTCASRWAPYEKGQRVLLCSAPDFVDTHVSVFTPGSFESTGCV